MYSFYALLTEEVKRESSIISLYLLPSSAVPGFPYFTFPLLFPPVASNYGVHQHKNSYLKDVGWKDEKDVADNMPCGLLNAPEDGSEDCAEQLAWNNEK